MAGFTISVLSSLTAIGVVYLFYVASAAYTKRCVAKAECWWLPGDANTFRFVIRNRHRKGNLFGIRYRAWLRKDIPASESISVDTFTDTELAQGERLLLPGGDDLPMVCFRLENAGAALNLIVTDKMGNREDSRPIDDDSARIMTEFSARARTWLLFKHEISRLYEIQQYRILRGERRNVFRDYLLPMQRSQERQMKSVSEYASEVTATI
ncbi:MAG: hypothetical protein ACRD2N_01385 [Vicinamibacterales bacterium]